MKNRYHVLLSGALICLALSAVALAQSTAFTYQGRLTDGGSAANGNYDMQFRLYDAASAGSQVGSTFTNGSVAVASGIFTVDLDFGAAAFPGADRWIEIWLRPAGSAGGYTQLLPRTRIAPTPYAIKAATANGVNSTSGNSIVSALNDPGTSTTISDSVLPANIVRINPSTQQQSFVAGTDGSPAMINLRGSYSTGSGTLDSDFKVLHNGGFVAGGFVRDVGNTTGCASSIPATGAGTRFMWFPCRGSLRFGRVPTGQTNWDDVNQDDFTFAGGNQVTASGYGAFAYGDQVTVSSTVGVGFGSAVTVSGTAGFSSGASNVCSGFACTAIGYTTRAGGQGSVAIGYRTEASGDNSVTIGYRGSNCSGSAGTGSSCSGTAHIGSIVLAGVQNPATQTTFVNAQADGEMRVRAPGGIALRTSFAANSSAGVGGNTGCDLPAGSGTFTCSSSRTIKENFRKINGEKLLLSIRDLPMSTWNYKLEGAQSRHIGPVAEDFYNAFKFGVSDKAVPIQDLAGVSLVGVQALEARTSELQAENSALKSQLEKLDAANRALNDRLSNIEKRLAAKQHAPRHR